jgi:hypothetical protein
MYPEFVPIYVMLGVAIALLAALIVLAVLILKKLNNRPSTPARGGVRPAAAGQSAGGAVFCRSCGKQFDGAMRFCPHCGTNR